MQEEANMRADGALRVSAHDVAREIRRRLPGVGRVVVQKLLYYCQGWHLAHTGQPLFSERIEAWTAGPVVATLWREEERQMPRPEPHSLQPDALQTVGYVVSRYGAMTGPQLIDLTHEEAPWRDISRSEKAGRDEPIPLESIRAYFESELADQRVLAKQAVSDPRVVQLLSDATRQLHEGPWTEDDPEEIRARLEALG